MVFARIRGTREQLRALGSSSLRLHRSGARKIGDGLYEVPAVLEDHEVSLLELNRLEVIVRGDVSQVLTERLRSRRLEARSFNTPEELFFSLQGNDVYLDTDYIESWISNLGRLFPAFCTSVPLPNKTWEGRFSSAVRLRAGDAGDRPVVLFTGGVHAAELGGSDSCIYFLYRLINAYQAKGPIVLGNKTFNAEQVQDMVENIDIFVFPLVNPDGRVFVQTKNQWWRKNRNPNAGMRAIGVDINRNFDFLWASGIGSSFVATDDTYKGPAAFSEPETRNVQWLLDSSGADFFIDMHGPSGLLVYTWGDAADQSDDPGMSFLNPLWEGKRSSPYGEYLSAADTLLVSHLGDRIVSAANLVNNGSYESHQSYSGLYPTTATSDDYAFSRHLAVPGQRKTYAYTLEYGPDEFIPPYSVMRSLMREVNAAMLELCAAAVALPVRKLAHAADR